MKLNLDRSPGPVKSESKNAIFSKGEFNFATYSKQISYLKGALKKNETEVKKANSKIALFELELKAANQRISILAIEGSRTSVVKVESASRG